MRMHNPPHPGEILHDLWLEPLGLSITDVAKANTRAARSAFVKVSYSLVMVFCFMVFSVG